MKEGKVTFSQARKNGENARIQAFFSDTNEVSKDMLEDKSTKAEDKVDAREQPGMFDIFNSESLNLKYGREGLFMNRAPSSMSLARLFLHAPIT